MTLGNGFLPPNPDRDGRSHGEQIRVLQERLDTMQTKLASLENTVTSQVAPDIIEPPIDQLLRNSDGCYSVDDWHNTVAAGGKQAHELALVYTHAADPQVVAYDAAIDIGIDATRVDTTAAFFDVSMVGQSIIVDGAGAAGARFVDTIASYVSPTRIHTTGSALTTVTAARVRVNAQKLAKNNGLLDPAATTTDSIKEPTHADWASNIQSPKWDTASGTIQFGNEINTITFFLGWESELGDFFAQIQPLQAGRPLRAQFKLAFKNKYIKPKGKLYITLYNNSNDGLEPLTSGDFALSANVVGTPAITVTTEYMVVSYTDLDTVYVSRVLSVAGAPTSAAYNPPEVQVDLEWGFIAGIIRTEVYRKIGGANVFLLETLDNGLNLYYDVNTAQRVDTGSASFPVIPFALSHSRCYAETTDFEGIIADGTGAWRVMNFVIPMTPTTSLAGVAELALRIGVTEACAFQCERITLAETDTTVTAPTGETPFVAGMAGLDAIVRDRSNSNLELVTTIASFTSSSIVELSDALPWTPGVDTEGRSTVYVEIAYSDDYGYLCDLFGLSLNRGQWAAHTEDKNRALLPTALPAGSTQGGTGGDGGPGDDGGGGGVGGKGGGGGGGDTNPN